MPRVDAYDTLQVPLRAEYQQNVDRSAATAEAFGAGIGRGLQQVGQGVNQLADVETELMQRDAETEARDALNKTDRTMNDAAYGENGYLYSQGKDALDRQQAYKDRLEQIRSEGGAKLSARARQIYDQASQAKVTSELGTAMQHAGREKVKWQDDTDTNRVKLFQDEGLAAYQDDAKIAGSIQGQHGIIDSMAKRKGWDPATTKLAKLEAQSTTYSSVAMQRAQTDPLAAKKYIDDHKDDMTAEDYLKIDKTLQPAIEDARAQQEVNKYTGGAPGTGYTGATLDAGSDPGKQLIRAKEGWTEGFYDKNHWRVGYSSDTITTADGKVIPAAPGMRISRVDAERDLDRRIQLQRADMRQINGYDRLSVGCRAALDSVYWNYGGLPFAVKAAIASGAGDAGVADAIEALAPNNGGINANRRKEEAAIARGGAIPQARTGATGQLAETSFTDREKWIQSLDPNIQDKVRSRINALETAQQKDAKASEDAAKQSMWETVMRGGTPDDVDVQTKSAAGEAATASAWSYVESRNKRGDPITDEETLASLNRQAVQDPGAFAGLNLNDYNDRVSRADMRALREKQNEWVKDQRVATEKGLDISSVMSRASSQLQGAGLMGLPGSTSEKADMAKRRAAFENALVRAAEDWKEQNPNKPFNQEEQQKLINKLLVPIILRTPGKLWGSNDQQALSFEAETRTSGALVMPAEKYKDIPSTIKTSIENDLKLSLGRDPTPAEVEARYADFRTGSPAGTFTASE